jgi:hypothetical protein
MSRSISNARSCSAGRISLFERPREELPSKCRIPQRSRGSDRQKSRECGGLFTKGVAPVRGEPTDPGSGFGFSACHRPPRRQTLREFRGAVRGRGSAWSAAACRRCVGRAGVNSGLPAGCDHHGLKQGRSVLGLEEACCAHRDGGPAGWSICGRTSSGGTIGGRSGGTNCWTTGRWRRPARSNNVGSIARASSGVRRGRSPLVSGRFLGQGAAALTLADTRPGNLCKN